MRSWKRLAQLSWSERRLLALALLLFPLTALTVATLGFRRWQRFLAQFTPRRGGEVRQEIFTAQAQRTAHLVEAAARHGLYRPNCLQRSLTLWWLLQRQGIVTEVRIGTRKSEERFEAHAWVEYQGVVLNDRSDIHRQYTAFDRTLTPMEANS